MSPPALVSLALVLLLGSGAVSADTRIVGGSPADIIDHPYQVSLNYGPIHFCGGSIIDRRHILTAAHCVDDKLSAINSLIVYTGANVIRGSRDGAAYKVKKIVIHREWTGLEEDSHRNDIAIVTLTRDIVYDLRTMKIELATRPPKNGTAAVVTGWGSDKAPPNENSGSTHLQKANMTILTMSECQMSYPTHELYAGHVCALRGKGVGVCMGDSGGPLVVGDELVGIVSWGIACARGAPDVYTNVYFYRDWIRKNGAISVVSSTAVLIACALMRYIC